MVLCSSLVCRVFVAGLVSGRSGYFCSDIKEEEVFFFVFFRRFVGVGILGFWDGEFYFGLGIYLGAKKIGRRSFYVGFFFVFLLGDRFIRFNFGFFRRKMFLKIFFYGFFLFGRVF